MVRQADPGWGAPTIWTPRWTRTADASARPGDATDQMLSALPRPPSPVRPICEDQNAAPEPSAHRGGSLAAQLSTVEITRPRR